MNLVKKKSVASSAPLHSYNIKAKGTQHKSLVEPAKKMFTAESTLAYIGCILCMMHVEFILVIFCGYFVKL